MFRVAPFEENKTLAFESQREDSKLQGGIRTPRNSSSKCFEDRNGCGVVKKLRRWAIVEEIGRTSRNRRPLNLSARVGCCSCVLKAVAQRDRRGINRSAPSVGTNDGVSMRFA